VRSPGVIHGGSRQTKNANKPVPVANSSPSDSGGWIGLTGITGAYGIIVTDLASDDSARGAGLKIADTIIAVDDASVKTMQMMDTIASSRAPARR
jgi:C-terminal processing protease CtpA/Prc